MLGTLTSLPAPCRAKSPIMHHNLIYESASLVLDYDLVDNVLDARWTAAQTLATTRTGYEQVLLELPALQCHRLLDDRRESHLMWDELAEWMATDWYPRAHRAGLRHHAMVFAKDFFGHRATEVVLARIDDGQLVGYKPEPAARRALLATSGG